MDRILCDASAETNRAMFDGRAPLYTASPQGHLAFPIETLSAVSCVSVVDIGAEQNQAMIDDRVPLQAVFQNHLEVVRSPCGWCDTWAEALSNKDDDPRWFERLQALTKQAKLDPRPCAQRGGTSSGSNDAIRDELCGWPHLGAAGWLAPCLILCRPRAAKLHAFFDAFVSRQLQSRQRTNLYKQFLLLCALAKRRLERVVIHCV